MKVTEKTIKKTWDQVWEGHSNNSFIKVAEKIFYYLIPMQFGSRTVYKTLEDIIKNNNIKDFSIIECGCGSGYIQKAIYEKHNCETYFLDISKVALDYAKHNLKNIENKDKLHFLEMSALNMRIEDDTFDIVWNSGVIEHFHPPDQKKMISEMLRITKKNGFVVIFAPSIYGKVYLKMKKRAERLGTWQAGKEVPLSTLENIIPSEYQNNFTEISKGHVYQLHYLKYIFKNLYLRYLATFFLEILQYILTPFDNMPGYYLVTVIRKK